MERRFSLPLTKLHGELESLRRKADQLEKKLQKKYDTKLQLKVDRKLGPVLYLQVKTEPEKLAQDPSTVLVAKSGSSRTYVVTVGSLPLRSNGAPDELVLARRLGLSSLARLAKRWPGFANSSPRRCSSSSAECVLLLSLWRSS